MLRIAAQRSGRVTIIGQKLGGLVAKSTQKRQLPLRFIETLLTLESHHVTQCV